MIFAAGVLAAIPFPQAAANNPIYVREVRGELIERVGDDFTVRQSDGTRVKLKIPEGAQVHVLENVKPDVVAKGAYVLTSARTEWTAPGVIVSRDAKFLPFTDDDWRFFRGIRPSYGIVTAVVRTREGRSWSIRPLPPSADAAPSIFVPDGATVAVVTRTVRDALQIGMSILATGNCCATDDFVPSSVIIEKNGWTPLTYGQV